MTSPARGESRENEENGCGAVVNDDSVFRASEAREQFAGVIVALAASAGCQAVFEIAVLRGGVFYGVDHRGG